MNIRNFQQSVFLNIKKFRLQSLVNFEKQHKLENKLFLYKIFKVLIDI